MTKQEFLDALAKGLKDLPQSDINEHLAFYSEMIDDRLEEGVDEAAAVAELGDPATIAADIVAQTPITRIVKEKIKPKRRLTGLEIVLLVLGAPLWIPLLSAAFAVLLSVYVVIWSVVFVFWTVFAAFAFSSLACLFGGIFACCTLNGMMGLGTVGASLILAGLSILAFFAALGLTLGTVKLTKRIFVGSGKKSENREEA